MRHKKDITSEHITASEWQSWATCNNIHHNTTPNNIYHFPEVALVLPGIAGFKCPVPSLDQVIMTLYSEDDPLEKFTYAFGKPVSFKSMWKFKNGIRLSKYNINYWYQIFFEYDIDLYRELHCCPAKLRVLTG